MAGVTDKALVRQRFRRTLRSYGGEAVVQRSMASGLVSMLAGNSSGAGFERVLEVGSGSGILTSLMLDAFDVGRYSANDLVGESRECLEPLFGRHPEVGFSFLEGDAESLPIEPSRFDLVVSSATLQWFDDLDAFFARIGRMMEPGALFAFTTFGGSTMQEVSALTGAGLDYREADELGALAGRHFEVLELREEILALSFASPEEVLRHISRTGVNGIGRTAWTKGRHREFTERYRERFACEGGVRLTYHPLYCCLRKREEGL